MFPPGKLYYISPLLLQLLDFLSDNDEGTAEDVLEFVREAIQQYPRLKGNVVGRLLDVFGVIKSVRFVIKIVSAVIKCVNSLTTVSTGERSGYWESTVPVWTISLAWFRRSGSLWERLVM